MWGNRDGYLHSKERGLSRSECCQRLDLTYSLQNCEELNFCVYATRSVTLCYGSLTRLIQGFWPSTEVSSSTLYHSKIWRFWIIWSFLQNITLVHPTDDIMFMRLDVSRARQVMASNLDDLVRHMHSRRWETNPVKIQGPGRKGRF